MTTKEETFKGHKLIVLMRNADDKFPFKFGLGKAKLILDNIDEIREFVDNNAGGETQNET